MSRRASLFSAVQGGRRSRLGVASAAVCAGLLAASAAEGAAARAGPVRAKPDWNGVWVVAGTGIDLQDGSSLENGGRVDPTKPANQPEWRRPPKLKGAYQEKYEATVKAMAAGIPAGGDLESCKPQGMPRFWSGPDAFEIIQTAKQINVFQEWNEQTRRIYVDGRKHPADWDASANGHSIGHWEGQVLVIDTIGVRDDTLVGGQGVATHSDALKISERIRSTGPNLIEVEMTAVDPKAFVQPWVVRIPLRRKPGMEILPYECRENLRDPGGFSAGAVRK